MLQQVAASAKSSVCARPAISGDSGLRSDFDAVYAYKGRPRPPEPKAPAPKDGSAPAPKPAETPKPAEKPKDAK